MIKRLLIIGPSGIGKIHFREFLKLGYNEIGLLGKRNFRSRKIDFTLKRERKILIYNLKNLFEAKKFSPKITTICSPFIYHKEHIDKVGMFCKNILVEKPLVAFKKRLLNKRIHKFTKKIINNKKLNILTNLPFVYLAEEFKNKKLLKKKINNFNFKYFTKGNQKYDNIALDLVPHAVSFILSLNNEELKLIKIKNITKSKNFWKCKLILNNCKCAFHFKQNKDRVKTHLSFRLNKDFFKRIQIKNEEKENTFVKNYKKIYKLNNPMSESIRKLAKAFIDKKKISKNSKLTIAASIVLNEIMNYD